MPDVRNCRRCGKIFNYLGGIPICQACKDMDEEDFKRVKEYLYKNPGASLSEVSSVLEISVEKIRSFLKDGRLEIMSNEGNMILECENCGKAITTGRLCNDCQRGVAAGFKSAAKDMSSSITQQEEFENKRIGMRYLTKDDKK